jgi:hypothetical protein
MTSSRWLGLAVSAVAAVSVLSAGASALAASPATPHHTPQTNDRWTAGAAASTKAPAVKHTASGPTVTHHLSLAASAFAPDGLHNTANDYFNEWDATSLSNTDPSRCFNAGLQFPPDVTLKSVRFYYTGSSTTMLLQLNRQDLINHTFSILAQMDTPTVTNPTYTSDAASISPAYAQVNMSDYAYSVGVCPDGTTTFSGLIITYTQPAS